MEPLRSTTLKGEIAGEELLAIARESLGEAFGLAVAAERGAPWLREPGASFVTLTRGGALRGCVGSILAYRSLYADVRANAKAAAFDDTRFRPLVASELELVRVEVSLLTPPEPFPVAGERDALARLRPHIDGVILEVGRLRSTFLPQVWEQLPEPADFLAHLKAKAGLPPGFWSQEVRLLRYQVTKWREAT
jgi:AmmeMemoRadiSam system protein A